MSNILLMTSAAPARAGFYTSEKRPPLGLGQLISILKKRGHAVYFSDQYLKSDDILETAFIEDKAIDFVGIYSNTICLQSTIELIEKLGRKKDSGWKGKIIIGGPHTSVGEDDFPEYVDHIVKGEGENALPEIIEGKISNKIIIGKKVDDLDILPLPSWEEFIFRPYDWTINWNDVYPVYTMNTSRGCPYDCTFCSVKSIWGKSYRYMSAERIVSDIEFMIENYGARGIYFREDHFTLNKSRTEQFCNLLLKKNIDIDWYCETRVDSLGNLEYQKLMNRAGCKGFYIGVESGSPKMLEFFKKGETIEQFITAFDNSKIAGIKTYASFVVGIPNESEEDRIMTDKLIERIKPDLVGKNVFVGIPGSELYDYIKKHNLYDFEDKNHILYPNSYLKNIKKYYGDIEYFNVFGKTNLLKDYNRRIEKSVGYMKKSLKELFGMNK